MQTVLTCSRVVVRAITHGLAADSPADAKNSGTQLLTRHFTISSFSSSVSNSPAGPAPKESAAADDSKNDSQHKGSKFHTVRCGFGKDMVNGPSEVHVTDHFGDDACFVAHHKTADVIGVADGVGGWRNYGIDPSAFSRSLMRTCYDIVTLGTFNPVKPRELLATAYNQILLDHSPMRDRSIPGSGSSTPRSSNSSTSSSASSVYSTKNSIGKSPPIGSSTACVVMLDRIRNRIYTANLGDSGFLVLRNGKIVHRSSEQCHYFNTPYQLSLPPDNVSNCLSDSPWSADASRFEVEENDVIVVATDGLFDNLPVETIEDLMKGVQGMTDAELQAVCNTVALQARRLAFDSNYMSPFAVKANEKGYQFSGGKPDDITVVMAMVKSTNVEEQSPIGGVGDNNDSSQQVSNAANSA